MKSIVMTVFGPKAQLTLFLRMRTKEIAETAKTYSDTSYSRYRNSVSPMRMTTSDFWPGPQFTKNRKLLLSLS